MTHFPSMSGANTLEQGGKRARTRARLIAAAAALIGEHGFERTSLEKVAARAGVTRGAIYGNFRNKEDLFLAVVAARWEPVAPPMTPGADFATQMRAMAEAVVAAMPARRAAAVGAASFQLYALTHPAMQERVATANAALYGAMTQRLRGGVPDGAMAVPPDMFVRIMHALIDGLMFLHALTPDLITAEVVRGAFAMVATTHAVSKAETP
jgi:AcrR family transcriptional regulator